MSTGVRAVVALVLTFGIAGAALAYPYAIRGAAFTQAEWRNPWFALLLLLVPLVWWWSTFGQDRRRPRMRIGAIAPLVKGPRGVRAQLRDLPGILRSVSLVLLILAICQPISLLQEEKREETGIDIMVVIDLSISMRAVLDGDPSDLPGDGMDLKPGEKLTRIDTAKIVVRDFIGRRKTDRIGTVVFAKEAYIHAPTTLDYSLLSKMVGNLEVGSIDGRATAIGDALGTAVARLRHSDARSKVIILLTDGDSNAGEISPEYATELAVKHGCKVYTIQIGNGDEVEVKEGTDLFGQPIYVPRRFPVNPELLQLIAEESGGEHYIATDGKALAKSMHSVLDKLERSEFIGIAQDHEDLFPFLLIPGVLLIGLEVMLRALLLRRFP